VCAEGDAVWKVPAVALRSLAILTDYTLSRALYRVVYRQLRFISSSTKVYRIC
jgi:hypothetical protein